MSNSMGSIENTVYYCCVSKSKSMGGRILYEYSGGEHEIASMAALCLERVPPYHKWYFQTMGKKTFGFLIEEGYVYFAIVAEGIGNSGILQFLERVRDEFRKAAKKGSSRSMSNLSSLCIQEQLVPVIHRLITSIEHVSQTSNEWPAEASLPHHHAGLSPSPANDANSQTEIAASTKAPLLGKSSKHEKSRKKMMMKDHVIAMRDIELEENRKSTDRVVKVDTGTLDSNSQSGTVSGNAAVPKDMGPSLMRTRSGNQNNRKKWCRQVRIVLAIDAAVCLVMLVIWLIICGGTKCLH